MGKDEEEEEENMDDTRECDNLRETAGITGSSFRVKNICPYAAADVAVFLHPEYPPDRRTEHPVYKVLGGQNHGPFKRDTLYSHTAAPPPTLLELVTRKRRYSTRYVAYTKFLFR